MSSLEEELRMYRQAAYAPGSWQALQRQWQLYISFCCDYKLVPFPASQRSLCLYAVFLARRFKAPQSVVNYISGIKTLHCLHELPIDVFSDVNLKLILRGISRLKRHIPSQAQPVTPDMLICFKSLLDLNDPLDASFWALFLLAFFSLGRKSNLVPDSLTSFDPEKQLAREE